MLAQALVQFTLRLVCGMSLMLSATDHHKTASGFYRIQMLVVLGLSVLAALFVGEGRFAAMDVQTPSSLPQSSLRMICIAIAGLAFLGSILWTLQRQQAGYRSILLIAAASIAGIIQHARGDAEASSSATFQVLSDISSAAILGGALTGMLLGHWYLTAPRMSLDPLIRLTRLFGIAAGIRLVISAIGLYLGWQQLTGLTTVVLLTMRWSFGILGPLVAFVMTWQILKYKNTQSATGVLFVSVILTFLGELSAILLFFDLGISL